MIRRFALAALTAAVCTALVADVAGAFTRLEAICVKSARARARQSILSARTDAQTKLTTDLQVCFNDTGGNCVTGCLGKQAVDAKVFTDAIRACQNDQCQAGDPTGTCACKKQNVVASNACSDLAKPTDQVACVANAQLALFQCNQACAGRYEAGIIEVNGQYNDCLQGCSNP